MADIRNQLKQLAKAELGRDLRDDELNHLVGIYEGKVAGNVENAMEAPPVPNTGTLPDLPEPEEIMLDEPTPPSFKEAGINPDAKLYTKDDTMRGLKLGSAALAPALLSQTSGKTAMQVAGLPFEAAKGIGGQVIQNAPALAYGASVARQLKENMLADADGNGIPDMQETAQGEFTDAQKAGTAAGYLNFPKTAEMGAEKITSAVVPTEATNLIGTLAKALTGGARGILKAGTSAMGAVKPVGEATKGFFTDPATAPAAKMIAALIGASDKATEGEAIARLLGAPAGTIKKADSGLYGSGSGSDIDIAIQAGNQKFKEILSKPQDTWSENDIKHISTWSSTLKNLESKKESEYEAMKKEAEAKLKQGEASQKESGAFGALREGNEYNDLAKKAAVRVEMSNLIGQQMKYYNQLKTAAASGDSKAFESAMEKLKSLQGQTSAYISNATGQGAMSQSDKENLDRMNSQISEVITEAQGANLAMVGASSTQGYPIYLKLRGKLDDAIQGQINFLKASIEPFRVAEQKYAPTADVFNRFSGENIVIKNLPNIYGGDLSGADAVETMATGVELEQQRRAGERTKQAKKDYQGESETPEIEAAPEFKNYSFDEMIQLRDEAKAKGDTALLNRVTAAIKIGAYNRMK